MLLSPGECLKLEEDSAAGSDDDRSARNSVGGQDSASRERMDDASNDALAIDFVSAWDKSDNPLAVRDARAGIPEWRHSIWFQ